VVRCSRPRRRGPLLRDAHVPPELGSGRVESRAATVIHYGPCRRRSLGEPARDPERALGVRPEGAGFARAGLISRLERGGPTANP